MKPTLIIWWTKDECRLYSVPTTRDISWAHNKFLNLSDLEIVKECALNELIFKRDGITLREDVSNLTEQGPLDVGQFDKIILTGYAL
jgi:hypothetical protein